MRFKLRLWERWTARSTEPLLTRARHNGRHSRYRRDRRPASGAGETIPMSRLFFSEKTVLLSMKLLLGFGFSLWVPLAVAQSDLGALLDAGAKKLSAEEFREELVQRVVVGPLNLQGGSLEIMYANNGVLQGTGQTSSYPRLASIYGDWKFDDSGRICSSIRLEVVILPYRCQFWFKYAEQYFLSDSDSDRRMRVLRRTIKQ